MSITSIISKPFQIITGTAEKLPTAVVVAKTAEGLDVTELVKNAVKYAVHFPQTPKMKISPIHQDQCPIGTEKRKVFKKYGAAEKPKYSCYPLKQPKTPPPSDQCQAGETRVRTSKPGAAVQQYKCISLETPPPPTPQNAECPEGQVKRRKPGKVGAAESLYTCETPQPFVRNPAKQCREGQVKIALEITPQKCDNGKCEKDKTKPVEILYTCDEADKK